MLKYQNENIGESYSFKCRFHKKYTVPPHIHEYSELAYVRTGNLTASINGERVIIPEGHAAFIFPNVIHEYTPETPCEMWCAVYSNDFLQTFFRLYPDSAPENCIIPLGESKKYAEALVKLDPTNIIKLTGMLHLLYSELANKTNMLPRSRNDNSLSDRYVKGAWISRKIPILHPALSYEDELPHLSCNVPHKSRQKPA